jgi:phosphatidylglycerol:prolipoprotein diacylglycerol transferase
MAGLTDDTYGKPTQLPWGVDFGDGIARHPTQAYEILFVTALGWSLHRLKSYAHRNGALFRYFMVAYLAWRVLVDFLKPKPLIAGMNFIQWACVVGLALLFATRGPSSSMAKPEPKKQYV